MQILELAGKNFKIAMINMFRKERKNGQNSLEI